MGIGIQQPSPYPVKVEISGKWVYGVAWHTADVRVSVKCHLCISDPVPFTGDYAALHFVDQFRRCEVEKALVVPMTVDEFKSFSYFIECLVTAEEYKQITEFYQTEAHESKG